MDPLGTLLALLLALGTASAASLGVVQTEGGSVQGQNIPLGLYRSVEVFKGIPFAAKPGLFEKPRPHPGWSGILKATKFAPRCMQVSLLQTNTFGSEDCLYLNIWVPHGRKVSSDLPVMIWIYGGGFMVGGSMGPNFLNNYLYSGQELADRGNVIVVSVAYRVGVLGFLSAGDPTLAGNYGLWDQHAGIAWVHRNIRSFGGDPNNITIFGESAGGASVNYQILSPHNRGLIRRAISQSGVAFCPWAFKTNPRDVAVQVAEKVGCPTDHSMVDCLKTIDAGNLTMAAPMVQQGNPDLSSDLPVMIWIYGGGFMVGGSMGPNFLNNYLYSGQELADRGNVIVVSVAYRVGVLGFLSAGDPTLAGNYGLWDQHAGIAWVHRNIRSFGGDPNNITIFGESAGGASVNYQILSPHNRGLIRRAISQSGVAFCPWAFKTNPRDVAVQVAEKVGCPTDHSMVDCLKTIDAGNLTMAAPMVQQGNPDRPGVLNLLLTPVVDGDFLPDHPSELFRNAADVDYLLGVNNMDGHMFTSQDIPSLGNKNKDTPVEDVKRLLAAYSQEKGQAALDVAFAEYASEWGPSPGRDTVKRTAVDIGTDYIFLVPIQTAVFLHATTAKSGHTFSYLLSEPSMMAGPGKPYHDWVGSDHADDLQFVFGKPFSTPSAYADRHRALSAHMMAYWTNFARTGDPSVGPSPVPVNWPQFDLFSQQFLDITSDMTENSTSQRMRLRFVQLWTQVIPSLP